MKKNKFSHKVIAVFLTLNFLQSFIPYNMLRASNNGPNAPEAAAFEPVDATDMVNLLTGDFTYVLPLLNVPSPEGGYPLALAYHAGIAMDQEASWVGLGWNLNPGAINRNVNGFPDDYKSSDISEFFYDEGGSETFYSLSVGYGSPEGAFSVGLGFSWGGNRGLVGSVSLGIGIPTAGKDGVGLGFEASSDGNFSINAGYNSSSGLTLGMSAGTDGLGVSAGFNNNGEGFSVGAHSSGAVSLGFSISQSSNSLGLSITMTSNGIGIAGSMVSNNGRAMKGAGVGINIAFTNSINSGDYIVRQSSWTIPIMIPTNVGSFYASFGKQKIEWYLNKKENNLVTGPLFFHEGINSTIRCQYYNDDEHHAHHFYAPCGRVYSESITETGETMVVSEAIMDIYEFPLTSPRELQKIELDINNAVFPSYDNYTVDAQGISGNIAPTLLENGTLFGLEKTLDDKSIIYTINGEEQASHDKLIFNDKPEFYFANAFSTHTEVRHTSFNTNLNTSILDYSNYTNEDTALPRRKISKFIEYFTNEELLNQAVGVQQKGYLKPGSTDIDRTNYPESGIGAFKITATDGKTYHYSLPVYNHEIITRTYGAIDNKAEQDSYFEKRQLEPYATHWLLTAVTGPDYVDKNANGYADSEDYGYWVVFDYGLWSDTYAWKAPYGQDHIISEENSDIKIRYMGRKQIYYLNKVRTRTHTALFVKSLREDSRSYPWTYTSVDWQGQQNSGDFIPRFTIPGQFPLRLDKIILTKNAYYANVSLSGGGLSPNDEDSVDIHYPQGKSTTAYYNLEDNVLDINDGWQNAYENAIKVINFHYKNPNESLAKGTPNTLNSDHGRLSLDKVSFGGKEGISVIPPYTFTYESPQYQFDIEDKGNWGYHKTIPEVWSLNKIITPQGGTIDIAYEGHTVQTVINSKVTFSNHNSNYTITPNGTEGDSYTLTTKDDIGIQIGDLLNISFKYHLDWGISDDVDEYLPYDFDLGENSCEFSGTAIITDILNTNSFIINVDSNECDVYEQNAQYAVFSDIKYSADYFVTHPIQNTAGVRVASITTTDGANNYTTQYTYGDHGNGIGYVSYLPFAPELDREVPYSSELPAPKPMYEYVTVESKDALGDTYGSTQYHFNVIKEKEEEAIQYGDFFSISVNDRDRYNGTTQKQINIKEVVIEDNLAALGQLLELEVYNQEGQLLSKTTNAYFGRDDRPNQQGILQESYQTYKEINYNNEDINDKWLINSSTRRTYANALKSTTTISKGFSQSTYFDVYDEVTGTTIETISYASDGTALKIKNVPAYVKYPEMGSKVDNPIYKNMLSQQAAGYTYLKDSETGQWKTTGVGITTWNDEWSYRDFFGVEHQPEDDTEKIWRKHQTYVWEGEINSDGSLQNFTDSFDWSPGANQASNWKKISETTRYDHYSIPLEIVDINGNKISTKKNRYSDKVIATANAGYDEMFYSGAEDFSLGDRRFGGDVYRGDNTEVDPNAHTGNIAVGADTHERAFAVVPQQTGSYRVSVWVSQENYTATRVISPSGTFTYNEGEVVRAGNWVQLNFTIPVTAGEEVYVTTLAASAHFDDFRMHPIASSMTSYVYNGWDELSHILGADNLATHFEYDSAGRLLNTYVEVADFEGEGTGGFKLSKAYQYRHALIEELDTDDDGVIDPEELYEPLEATFHPERGYRDIGTLEVNPSGGSGEYAYRFGSGIVSGNNTHQQIEAIPYGGITTTNTFYVSSVPCTGGTHGYNARVVKIEIRDQVTGETRAYQKTYNKSCPVYDDQDEHGNHH